MSDRDSPANSYGFITVPDPRAYAAEARRQGKLVVWVPRGIRSKEKLFGIFAERLRFPDYFGWNWDALEECLQDVSWLPENRPICLVHERLPFGAGENRETYFAILRGAIATDQTRSRKLTAVVPE
jgi:RNAse (barnase) inhibitor barstar